MGLFSRKKSTGGMAPPVKPSIQTSNSNASFNSGSSSIKSPATSFKPSFNRSSAGSGSPSSPMTSISPTKIDIPRAPDPNIDPAGYLRSLQAVRERAKIMTDKATRNNLTHFDVDISKFGDVVRFVANIIKRDYDAPFHSIPPHCRYQHFCVGGRDRPAHMLATFSDVDNSEKCRRLMDLCVVSIVMDGGAGSEWSYKSLENNKIYRRSDGIAVAAFEMFKSGLFSSNPSNRCQVDKQGMKRLTVETLANGLQSRPGNEIVGLEGRAELLSKLGAALEHDNVFGPHGRPGNMLDYLLSHPSTQASSKLIVPVPLLWNVLMEHIEPIWPQSRSNIHGVTLGDAWPCSSMPKPAVSPNGSPTTFSPFPTGANSPAAWESILPFHKLAQWLCYSMMQPMQSLLKVHFTGAELLTGLPEYRNGGLFIDLGVISLKPKDEARGLENFKKHYDSGSHRAVEVAPLFLTSDDVVVEWRGVTIGFLDRLWHEVNKYLAKELAGNEISLSQLMEAGSFKAGREMAEVSRPNTREPPILIDRNGTIF
ncbi:hypothetical protein Cpir12675_000313 [Ceratocystis pirilliformis]|uniref:Uracil catabolism protein 4 n=1 Tax=Ceratocystis pirilliformis TaxID=259994 RepID=A0ABR3ZLL7_9PEZI